MTFGFTKLSTKGPSMMPSRISITTSGIGTKRRSPSAMIGASTAATPMSTSVGMALVDHAPSTRPVAACCGTPRHLLATRYARRLEKRVTSKEGRG